MDLPKLQALCESSNVLQQYIEDTYMYEDEALAALDDFDKIVKMLSARFDQDEKKVRSVLMKRFDDLGVYVPTRGGHS